MIGLSGTEARKYSTIFLERKRDILYLVRPVNPSNSVHKTTLALAALLVLVLSSNLLAQNGGPNDVARALSGWLLHDAPPGREHLLTDVIMREMPGWKRDQLGNLILRKGSGSPRRVIACALDRPALP